MVEIKYYEKGENITVKKSGEVETINIRLNKSDLPISTRIDEDGFFRIFSQGGTMIFCTNETFAFLRLPNLIQDENL